MRRSSQGICRSSSSLCRAETPGDCLDVVRFGQVIVGFGDRVGCRRVGDINNSNLPYLVSAMFTPLPLSWQLWLLSSTKAFVIHGPNKRRRQSNQATNLGALLCSRKTLTSILNWLFILCQCKTTPPIIVMEERGFPSTSADLASV